MKRNNAAEEEGDRSGSKRSRLEDDEFIVDEDEVALVKRVVGISAFDSSKGKNHTASGAYGVMKVPKRRLREALKQLKDERKKVRGKRKASSSKSRTKI